MDLVAHNRTMARNNRWSNHRLHHAMEALQPGEFEAERVGFFPSIKATLNHILAIDRYYLDALMEGGIGPAAFRDFVDLDDLASLAAAQLEQDKALIAFCDRLTADELGRRVITDRAESGRIPERIGDLLAHLFLHQIHHRGQVHAMLSGTAVVPPQLDEFILDYDLPFRKDEVDMLGLGPSPQASETS
jgi:uncharacterized damage-inducible protein DinB